MHDDDTASGRTTSTRRTRQRGERGIAIAMVGLLLIPMLIFAAFGVDLASWYARISAIQRAADAAALAGAVWMPVFDDAEEAAADSLLSNGFDIDDASLDISIIPGSTATSLRVVITDLDADRYFSGIFMDGPAQLTRYAEAEYNLPLPLGSPLHYFGGDITKVPDPPPDFSYTVQWPADYDTRPPTHQQATTSAIDCHITDVSDLTGRWSGNPPTYSSTGFGGGNVCGWSVSPTASTGSTSSPPPDYWHRAPSNVPCRVRENGNNGDSSNLGVWRSGPTRYSTSLTNTGSYPMCSWPNVGTDASLFSSHPNGSNVLRTVRPQNWPCLVGYTTADGYWNTSGVWQSGVSPYVGEAAADGNRLCTWSAEWTDTTTDQGPAIDPNRSPGFWAQIHGPGGDSNSGDAVNTRCLTQHNTSPCTSSPNPDYRDPLDPNQGIWYVIKAPPSGGSVTVSIFDAQTTPGNLNAGTGDSHITGSDSAFATTYRMYQQTNPLDFNVRTALGPNSPNTDDNTCHWSVNGHTRFQMQWVPLCTINMAPDTVYLLNVRTAERSGFANSAGRNGYAIQACVNNDCAATGQPSIHAYEQMVLYNNISGGDATFYLAEVGDQYAGRTLVVEMWDPGEVNSGEAWVYPQQPSEAVPRPVQPVLTTACEITSTRSGFPSSGDLNAGGVCSYRSSNSGALYNGHWVTMRIQIPSSYDCTPGVNPETTADSCWWGIRYDIGGNATDTTTWRAHIEGNPLQLTE